MLRLLLHLFFIFFLVPAKAQQDWHLVKDRNGIKVYAASSDTSKIKYVKTVAIIDGTIPKLISVFKDIDGQKQWVFNTKQASTIKKYSDTDVLYYVETSLPWPMQNRDVPIHMKIDENKSNNTVMIITVGEPAAAPLKNGKVRVKSFYGKWDVKQIANNKLSIDYFLYVDPSGSIPAWITNMFITKGPYETVSHLAGQLKK